jgi:micrococcal nuclease
MNQLKKAGIPLVLGVIIILVRAYEAKQTIPQTPEISGNAELIRVVDGDTLVVAVNGKEEKIRIIGINTPESVQPNSPIECFGEEARDHMNDLLSDAIILRITTDPTQDTRDRYRRLLAHIFIGDMNIAEQMIIDGYAYEYTYRAAYIYQLEYKKAEKEAQNNGRGLWSPETCNGKR